MEGGQRTLADDYQPLFAVACDDAIVIIAQHPMKQFLAEAPKAVRLSVLHMCAAFTYILHVSRRVLFIRLHSLKTASSEAILSRHDQGGFFSLFFLFLCND